MPHCDILVVVVDGLRASALGAYGNTSYATPALDEFAADSLLVDWCFAPTTDLLGIYRSLWYSQHPSRIPNDCVQVAANVPQSLPQLLAKQGYRSVFISDEPQLSPLLRPAGFDDQVTVTHGSARVHANSRPIDAYDTHLARVFATASEVIQDRASQTIASTLDRNSQFVWVHARGLYGAWDAPLEIQESLREEGDPPPVVSMDSPVYEIGMREDPDSVLRYSTAYAAQVVALDACWKQLTDEIAANSEQNNWFVVLLGARGFPLGEHGHVGGVDNRLYGEQIHVPCLIRSADGSGRLSRESQLMSLMDILPTLVDNLSGSPPQRPESVDGMRIFDLANHVRSASLPPRTLLAVSPHADYAIRTNSWCLRGSKSQLTSAADIDTDTVAELFVRPDDRWESNDVSKLRPNVVDELQAAARQQLQAFYEGDIC
jgi:arylsulfatase A-like enzyme